MPIVGNLIEITVELDKFLAAEGVATLFKRSVYLALEQTCQNNLNNDQGRTKELFQSKNSQKCDLGNVEPNDDSIKDQGECIKYTNLNLNMTFAIAKNNATKGTSRGASGAYANPIINTSKCLG
eukprot:CAMPEP_0116018742 /NCGR_PEP_ID=MMETSP0321-20121206/8826_1 /TAXON_ID=163516 /ORGANISM="Leptocylindrus danicus var. danicus, Strain B650" /LENGTH=123 /DNA_ID=CAMNT_0003489187 /DNA_START=211 /DNA_END=582 /DNA_ORIENTATION=-